MDDLKKRLAGVVAARNVHEFAARKLVLVENKRERASGLTLTCR